MLTVTVYLLHGEWEPVVERNGKSVEWSGQFFARKRDALASWRRGRRPPLSRNTRFGDLTCLT